MAGRSRRWLLPIVAALAGALAFGASRLLADVPALAEAYANSVSPLLTRPLSLLTGPLPFALSELLLIGYVSWVTVAAGVATRSLVKRRRRVTDVLAGGIRRVLRDGGILVFLLYVLFGFNYARPPLETRAGLGAWEGVEAEELTALAEASVALANDFYLELHGTPDVGAATLMPDDLAALERAVDQGWVRTAEVLELPASVGAAYGRVKRPWISPLLARMSLFGVYAPFTAEANVVQGVPAVRAPMSMCHEKAHQRGIAVEAEANFMGFLACALAPDAHARYSAVSFAQSQLVNALPARDRRRMAAARLPGVQRDLEDLSAYLEQNRTRASAVQSAVNDRYLRANRVPGGIRSYSLSVRLLILYAQQNGGALLPLGADASLPAPAG